MKKTISFSKPYITGSEKSYIEDVISKGFLSGDGMYTEKCETWLKDFLGAHKTLLTHSCTAALEMTALLLDLKEGDEIIMPSFTFVSTANAFVLRGAIPVFVDINSDDLNINANLIENAITPKTKAIVIVHYAGVACDMEIIQKIAKSYNLYLIEDAAQAINSFYKNKPLGSFGDFSTFSFHNTKNIVSGEGGALVINNPNFSDRAEIIREKGTNRKQFLKKQVDKYTWVDKGSSFLPSELVAAFLWGQLENIKIITEKRTNAWNFYFETFSKKLNSSKYRLTKIQNHKKHNGHIFYLMFPNSEIRDRIMLQLYENHIRATFHYIPLHDSPFGNVNSKTYGDLSNTNKCSKGLLRLPIWSGIDPYQNYICQKVFDLLEI